jgi:PspAA-like protein
VIVRLMGEGQFRVADDLRDDLNALDQQAMEALDAEDETELDARLDDMWDLVRQRGEPLAPDDLSPSDVVVPPSDLTLQETRKLFAEDGLIPDLPG